MLRLVRSSVFLLVLGLLWTTSAPRADAQSQPKRDKHTIDVAQSGDDACTYHIEDQTDQDLFVISPEGRVKVKSRGLWVDVEIQNAAVNGRSVPGARSVRTLSLRPRPGRSRATDDSFDVRGTVGATTEHQLRILCCPSVTSRGEGCPEWVEAQPYQATTGDASGGFVGGDVETARGPMAPVGILVLDVLPVNPPLPPGGPKMRVEEN